MAVHFTEQELDIAYRKFKAWAYYDSSSLVMFDRTTKFEENEQLDRNLKDFCAALNTGDVEAYLENVDFYVLPKKVTERHVEKDESEVVTTKRPFFYSNERESQGIPLCESDQYNFMIDATVEQQLIAVLWLMNVGVYLQDEDVEKYCYGNILCIDKCYREGKRLETGLRLYHRYFDKYSQWRDQGVKCGRKIVEKEIPQTPQRPAPLVSDAVLCQGSDAYRSIVVYIVPLVGILAK